MDGDAQNLIDRVSIAIGRLTAWLTLFMVITTVVIVVMRYAFDAYLVWLQETLVWMHATVFMLGAAYTLQHEGHVRVDVFIRRLGDRGQAWVNLCGVVLFLLPMCVFLGAKSYDFTMTSWAMHEASREPGGLPYPLLPIIKTVLVLMPLTVGLQGLSMLARSIAVLRHN